MVPLDWGIGHATRCIPVINALNRLGVTVYVAGEGPIVKILEKAQGNHVILPLKGYSIKYSSFKAFFFLKLILQFPKVLAVINWEHLWLKKIVKQHQIDAVISDNRFGLYHPQIPCIFITHQLFIETGNQFFNNLAQKINYQYLKKFTECWIPDVAGKNNLAGKLSHPVKLPAIPVRYLGILSRLKRITVEEKHGLLILLSGPEPQRSIFENILLAEIETLTTKVTLVRGLPMGGKKIPIRNEYLLVHDHLPSEALSELIQRSENIIARCGYSTVMDLIALKQKAILVPTPGQSEQEYLAGHLLKNKMFFTCPQENFSLQKCLSSAWAFQAIEVNHPVDANEKIIADWINGLKKVVIASQ
ncbi:MAG: glycosyltransferase [Ferruginibacter sp.]